MVEIRDHAPVGTDIWYHLPCHAWVPGKVVDGVTADENGGIPVRYPPPKRGMRHLRLEFDPNNDYGYRPTDIFGYRMNVAEGSEPGQWQLSPPKDWDKTKEAWDMRQQIRKEETLRLWAAQARSEDARAL